MSKFKTLPIKTQLVGLGVASLVVLLNGCSSKQQKAETTCIKIYPDMINHFDKYADCVVNEGGYEPVQAEALPGQEKIDLVTPQPEIKQQVVIRETKVEMSQADKDAIERDKQAQENEKLRKFEWYQYNKSYEAMDSLATAYNYEVNNNPDYMTATCVNVASGADWYIETNLVYDIDPEMGTCQVTINNPPPGNNPAIGYDASSGEILN